MFGLIFIYKWIKLKTKEEKKTVQIGWTGWRNVLDVICD